MKVHTHYKKKNQSICNFLFSGFAVESNTGTLKRFENSLRKLIFCSELNGTHENGPTNLSFENLINNDEIRE